MKPKTKYIFIMYNKTTLIIAQRLKMKNYKLCMYRILHKERGAD